VQQIDYNSYLYTYVIVAELNASYTSIDFDSVANRVDKIDRVDCESTARSTESTKNNPLQRSCPDN